MIDKLQEYYQSYLNLETAARQRVPEQIYEGFFKDDLKKFKELLDELDDIPREVDYTSENDIFRLRAFIKEELRRNRELETIIKGAFMIFREYNICPLDNKDYPSELCQGRDCTTCWMSYLKDNSEGEMPFK